MPIADAVAVALKLKKALAEQVGHAQTARTLLKAMQPDALLSFAAQRESFNASAALFAHELAMAIGEVAKSHGREDISMAELSTLEPFEGEQLIGVLREIRSLSLALSELDDFNQQLAERALVFVRAYVSHLAPPVQAYTRTGAVPQRETSTLSERA